jgi:hypothetical protein
MIGISLHGAHGIGDKLQFSSFPENYFKNTGEKVIDVDRSWIFDHNPYVIRDAEPERVINLWTAKWPSQSNMTLDEYKQNPVFASIADRTASIFGHTCYLRHPRLYQYENLPVAERRIVLHTTGKIDTPIYAQGEDRPRRLSAEIMSHIRETYADYEIIQIGAPSDIDAQVIDRRGIDDMWEVVRIIAQASIFIGVDSGPYWIASCYPRIFRKRVMMQYSADYLRKHFVPMHVLNPHVHWHDASCLYFNRTTEDAGISYSYLKL